MAGSLITSLFLHHSSAKANLLKQLESTVRVMYSNPPAHGARVVAKILSDPDKYKKWKGSVKEMSKR